MLISGRRLLLALSIIVVAVGIVMILIIPGALGTTLAVVIVACGVISILALAVFRPAGPSPHHDSGDIRELDEPRMRELMRGTGLFLREMEYRYSVRLDTTPSGDRRAFTADVNQVHLGFIPAVVTDNTNGRQGYGYVAFVHDGKRWRGPGLPCPAGQAEAVRHAARCVSPLASEEETKYEG
jgi:hypothetical protein